MKKNTQLNSIRIIGGQWRGRRLPVLCSNGLRPTTDRVRETVFNWLMYDVQGAHCLDLCAGTGALSLECLSRGATSAVMVESNAAVVKQLQQNIQALSAPATVVQQNVLQYLRSVPTRRYDIVFIDPPFDALLQEQICQLLIEQDWLSDHACIYIEQRAKYVDVNVPAAWHLHRDGKAGQSRYCLYHAILNNHPLTETTT